MKKIVFLHAISALGCVLGGILLCAVQTSFLPHYLNDAFFVPDLLLCLTVGLGVLAGAHGSIYGALFGIYAGVLADSTAGCGIFLLPLVYMLCGYGAHVCADLLPNKKIPVYLGVGTVAAVLRAVVALVYVFLSVGSVQLLDVTRYVCIPLIFGTLVALLPTYTVSFLLTLPIRKIKHQHIDKII
jgi:hypothetical protein